MTSFLSMCIEQQGVVDLQTPLKWEGWNHLVPTGGREEPSCCCWNTMLCEWRSSGLYYVGKSTNNATSFVSGQLWVPVLRTQNISGL